MRNIASVLWVLCSVLACNRPSDSTGGSATAAPPTAPPAAAPPTASAAPAASAAPLSDEAAEKVALDTEIAFLKAAVADKARFPVKDATTYTAETDPNKLLGRPGQYVVKMGWKLEGEEATIEVFRSTEDAQKRADYTRQIGASAPMFLQYVYLNSKRSAVLRLPKELTPAKAKDWQTMFEAL
jgi:hypothetical protein